MKTAWMRGASGWMVLAMGLLWGCAAMREPAPRVASYISPAFREGPTGRIVVVPFDGSGCSREARAMVTQAIALTLQEVTRRDVIVAPVTDEQLAAESAMWRRGRVNVDSLVAARKQYLADAFLFGVITHYKEYDPPILGLKLNLLCARTGDVLWAADALYDARDSEVRRRAKAHFERSGMHDLLYGPGLVFVSPQLFARFVAADVVAPLRQTEDPKGKEP